MANELTTTDLKSMLPQPFKQDDLDIIGADNTAKVFDNIKRAPEYVIFPSHYKLKIEQRMIFSTAGCKLLPGKDGTPNRYVCWPGYSKAVFFDTRTLYDGVPFIAQFPLTTFSNMFYEAAYIDLQDAIRHYSELDRQPPMFEIHFIKHKPTQYELLYMGTVEYDGVTDGVPRRHKFVTTRRLYEKKGYEKRKE